MWDILFLSQNTLKDEETWFLLLVSMCCYLEAPARYLWVSTNHSKAISEHVL